MTRRREPSPSARPRSLSLSHPISAQQRAKHFSVLDRARGPLSEAPGGFFEAVARVAPLDTRVAKRPRIPWKEEAAGQNIHSWEFSALAKRPTRPRRP